MDKKEIKVGDLVVVESGTVVFGGSPAEREGGPKPTTRKRMSVVRDVVEYAADHPLAGKCARLDGRHNFRYDVRLDDIRHATPEEAEARAARPPRKAKGA